MVGKTGLQTAFRIRREERGDVDAGDVAGLFQTAVTRPAFVQGLFQQAQHVGQGFFAVAQHHQIDEGGQRLGAQQGAATGDDQRALAQILRPVGRAQGDVAQLQHVEHVGVAQLMGDGEGKAVQVAQRRAGFQRAQRTAVLPQDVACFSFRGHDPFGPPVFVAVDDTVKDLLSQIGHADFIGIGKGQAHTQANLGRVFVAGALFDTGVAAGAGRMGSSARINIPVVWIQKRAADAAPET